jgi:hypothetical protein
MSNQEFNTFMEEFEGAFDNLESKALEDDQREEEKQAIHNIPAFRMLVIEE